MEEPGKRIVIIEDDQIQTIALKQIAQRMGHSIVGMYLDPEEAIAKIPGLQPDLILSDINLENPIDGIEVVYQVQQTHSCPTIFLTGYSLYRMSERMDQIKNCILLGKPYTVNELTDAIGKALEEASDGDKV